MKVPKDANAPLKLKFSWHDVERRTGFIFIAWVFLLLVIDLLTLRCFPVPWIDEAMFTDPAASVVLQGHWASTFWFSRSDFSFWGGNTPAYSALLVPWLWLWGVSAAAVRSLNCALMALTMVCTWLAVKRLRLIPHPGIRLATLIALSLCYSVSYCVRCGRPDVLGMLIFSVGALCWSSQRKGSVGPGLFGCAVLIPFAGLQYAFYMPVLLGVLLWAGGKPAFSRIGTIVAGGIVGGSLLLAYFQHFAGWDGLLADMADVQSRRPHALWDNVLALMKGQIFFYYLGRPHFALLILTVIWLAVIWQHLTEPSRQNLLLGTILLLVPGVIIGFFSHFMAPYHWLAVAPSMILLASAVCQSWKHIGRATKVFCGLVALGLALSGRLVFIAMGAGLGSANYTSQIETTACALVHPGENILIDPQLYYAMKLRAGRIYVPQIVPQLTATEKESVTTAFLLTVGSVSDQQQWLTNSFGGRWIHLADLPVPYSQANLNPVLSKFMAWFHAGSFVGQPLSAYRRESEPPQLAPQR